MKITKSNKKAIDDAYCAYKQMIEIELDHYKEAFIKSLKEARSYKWLQTDDDFRHFAITGIIYRLKNVILEAEQMQNCVNETRDLI